MRLRTRTSIAIVCGFKLLHLSNKRAWTVSLPILFIKARALPALVLLDCSRIVTGQIIYADLQALPDIVLRLDLTAWHSAPGARYTEVLVLG